MGKPLQDHPHMSCLYPTPTCPLNLFQINVGIFTALEEIISPDLVQPGKFGLSVWFSAVQSNPTVPNNSYRFLADLPLEGHV